MNQENSVSGNRKDIISDLEDCAEQLQTERGFPSPSDSKFRELLKSYATHRWATEILTETEMESAIWNGFMKAENARQEA